MRNDQHRARKTALITGASTGIGYELARLFARDGFNLVLVARDGLRLIKIGDEFERSSDVSVTVLPKDLSQPTATQEIYDELQSKRIDVDILINNAGFGVSGPFSETNLQKERQMIQVNIVALTQLTKLFLPAMLTRNFGRILNVGSTVSFLPGPGDAVYCATKAYVLSFSEAIAEELRGTGVTVTTLCPGPTKTEFAARADMTDSKIFQGRVSSAQEVAEAGYRALMHGRTTAVVGWANKLLIFSLRFSPRSVVARISKSLLSSETNVTRAGTRQAH
jgi:short-subunit dehydrogenase